MAAPALGVVVPGAFAAPAPAPVLPARAGNLRAMAWPAPRARAGCPRRRCRPCRQHPWLQLRRGAASPPAAAASRGPPSGCSRTRRRTRRAACTTPPRCAAGGAAARGRGSGTSGSATPGEGRRGREPRRPRQRLRAELAGPRDQVAEVEVGELHAPHAPSGRGRRPRGGAVLGRAWVRASAGRPRGSLRATRPTRAAPAAAAPPDVRRRRVPGRQCGRHGFRRRCRRCRRRRRRCRCSPVVAAYGGGAAPCARPLAQPRFGGERVARARRPGPRAALRGPRRAAGRASPAP